MDDYIKRSDAIMTAMNYEGSGNAQDASQDIAAEIASIPAADVRENVHGEWILYNEPFTDTLCCSECEFNILPEEDEAYNFCPNCGADMRGAK